MEPASMAAMAAIMGGTGLLSGILGNASQERQMKAQMMARAAEQEAAPWTGMAAQTQGNFQGGNAGNLLAGAASGIGQAQAFERAAQEADTNKAMSNWLKMKTQQEFGGMPMMSPQASTSPWSVMGAKKLSFEG